TLAAVGIIGKLAQELGEKTESLLPDLPANPSLNRVCPTSDGENLIANAHLSKLTESKVLTVENAVGSMFASGWKRGAI
ncbi:MAG: hypothetical protein ACUVQG_14165, partial [Thermogutta sp.]